MTIPSARTSREIRSGRMNRRPPSLAVTLMALAIIFALAWVFFVRSGPAAPVPTVAGIQGTFTTSWEADGVPVTIEGRFAAVGSGNAGGSEHPPKGQLMNSAVLPRSGYDAAARTETTYGGVGPAVKLRRTVGVWPPVWRIASESPLDYQGLAAIVRSAVEDRDTAVGIKPLKQGDRAVWRAALTLDGKTLELVVDQATGVVTWYSDGRSTFTATIDWASPPPADQTYPVKLPAGTKIETVKGGNATYEASPATAGASAGYDPLVSDLAPDGYARKAVATFGNGAERAPGWLGEAPGRSPVPSPDERAVAQLYTRGLSWFTMEQIGPRAMSLLTGDLSDALDSTAATMLSPQQVTLQYGAFKGATASTWYQESGPSLFVAGRRRAVFVTGALTRQELIAFAEGLRPAGSGGTGSAGVTSPTPSSPAP